MWSYGRRTLYVSVQLRRCEQCCESWPGGEANPESQKSRPMIGQASRATPASLARNEPNVSTRADGRWAGDGALAVLFAVAFIVLFLAPPFLPYAFTPYPLIHWADVVDLATPLVLIPVYWLLFTSPMAPATTRWIIVFLVLTAMWVEGHGIHLVANAIGHLDRAQPGLARDLTEFADEKFSHYYWHGAALALSALILVRHLCWPGQTASQWWPGIMAAIVYGFAIFLIGDEGGTAPLVITFAAAVTFCAIPIGRRRLLASPVLTMFGVGYPVALVLFATWFVYWGGHLPQFSEIGLIK